MAHFKCLARKTRLESAESQADPIGDSCSVTAAPRVPRVIQRSTRGVIGANGAAREKFALGPGRQATQRRRAV